MFRNIIIKTGVIVLSVILNGWTVVNAQVDMGYEATCSVQDVTEAEYEGMDELDSLFSHVFTLTSKQRGSEHFFDLEEGDAKNYGLKLLFNRTGQFVLSLCDSETEICAETRDMFNDRMRVSLRSRTLKLMAECNFNVRGPGLNQFDKIHVLRQLKK